jgi:hypothetical protein
MIRQRRDYPIQLPLYLAAIQHSAPAIRAELSAPDAIWRRYIQEAPLRRAIDAPYEAKGRDNLLVWYSFSMQRWLRQISDERVQFN